MHDGKDDPEASELFAKIFPAVQRHEPGTQAQIAFYGSAVPELNHALSDRRARLDLIDAALPKAFWTLIVLTALVSIVSAFFVANGEHSARVRPRLVRRDHHRRRAAHRRGAPVSVLRLRRRLVLAVRAGRPLLRAAPAAALRPLTERCPNVHIVDPGLAPRRASV
jgi:hypothetical protein